MCQVGASFGTCVPNPATLGASGSAPANGRKSVSTAGTNWRDVKTLALLAARARPNFCDSGTTSASSSACEKQPARQRRASIRTLGALHDVAALAKIAALTSDTTLEPSAWFWACSRRATGVILFDPCRRNFPSKPSET